MEFVKMHGTGNDFIFILDLESKLKGQESKIAKKLCHSRFGIGADGLVLVRNSNCADMKMDIIIIIAVSNRVKVLVLVQEIILVEKMVYVWLKISIRRTCK